MVLVLALLSYPTVINLCFIVVIPPPPSHLNLSSCIKMTGFCLVQLIVFFYNMVGGGMNVNILFKFIVDQ